MVGICVPFQESNYFNVLRLTLFLQIVIGKKLYKFTQLYIICQALFENF